MSSRGQSILMTVKKSTRATSRWFGKARLFPSSIGSSGLTSRCTSFGLKRAMPQGTTAGPSSLLSGYAQDITERKRAEEALQESESRYRDITERKQAEEEKAKLEAQLQQAQKMESVGRLAGGVAHDFNNMLGVILGHAEMAMEKVDPAEESLHSNLEEIRKAAERSANLTRQLLAFARKQTVAPKVLDLNETVASMLKMLRRLVGEDIALVWLPGAELSRSRWTRRRSTRSLPTCVSMPETPSAALAS
jgi:signal transduction histidine kinase